MNRLVWQEKLTKDKEMVLKKIKIIKKRKIYRKKTRDSCYLTAFCEVLQTKTAMMRNKDEKAFELFAQALERLTFDRNTNMEEICLDLGVSAEKIEFYCMKNLGLSGEEVLNLYKSDLPVYFL